MLVANPDGSGNVDVVALSDMDDSGEGFVCLASNFLADVLDLGNGAVDGHAHGDGIVRDFRWDQEERHGQGALHTGQELNKAVLKRKRL